MLGTFLRLILSLGTVLALMFVLARFLNARQIRIGGGRVGAVRGGGAHRRGAAPVLEVVSRQGLSRASSLAVVRVSGQLLLLGVTESSVSVLREIDEASEEAEEAGGIPEDGRPTAPVLRLASGEGVGAVLESLRERTVRRG